jgi:hypothetical protein
MLVLIGCEFSGRVRDAFIAEGHDAVSCDLLPTEAPGPHMQCDVLEAARSRRWDLGVFHPPCTFLTSAGTRWFYHPDDRHLPLEKRRPHPSYPDRSERREEAVRFVREILALNIPRIALENPVGILSSRIRKPNQVIHPWMFGDDASKATCLWLKGLPKLVPTKLVWASRFVDGKPRWGNQAPCGADRLGPSADRWKVRSTTYPGIAKAMAEQWGRIVT